MNRYLYLLNRFRQIEDLYFSDSFLEGSNHKRIDSLSKRASRYSRTVRSYVTSCLKNNIKFPKDLLYSLSGYMIRRWRLYRHAKGCGSLVEIANKYCY